MFIKTGQPQDVEVLKFCKVCGKKVEECICKEKPEPDLNSTNMDTNYVHKAGDSGRSH